MDLLAPGGSAWRRLVLYPVQVVVVVYDERVMPDGPGMAQVLDMFEDSSERFHRTSRQIIFGLRTQSEKVVCTCVHLHGPGHSSASTSDFLGLF